MDVLSETWKSSEKSSESVVSHILTVRKKLEEMRKLARFNLEKAQEKQKAWYDQNARDREFAPNDQVLLLLPSSTSKLTAAWQGPYRVVKKIGKVNYLIEQQNRRKKKHVYHVNLLKKYEPARAMCCLAEEVIEEEIPDWRGDTLAQPVMGSHLNETQRAELASILDEFSSSLKSKPGQTRAAEHRIELNSPRPIRLPPYRIPHAYREAVDKELQEMEENGIIEPSKSEWAAPIVVAKKNDGSIHWCVDYYRKLNAVTPVDPTLCQER